ncbi:hypothetical protein KFE25_000713 [Diacronema lutheri]|uniref:WW domain-containing protein n=1 Tax=Diacronema lutheri TaxID=2081491 RepID=A0A8J5XS01_DIALT|nr:hypothetical protein KFE25_000713 [Diacronema lutheri]
MLSAAERGRAARARLHELKRRRFAARTVQRHARARNERARGVAGAAWLGIEAPRERERFWWLGVAARTELHTGVWVECAQLPGGEPAFRHAATGAIQHGDHPTRIKYAQLYERARAAEERRVATRALRQAATRIQAAERARAGRALVARLLLERSAGGADVLEWANYLGIPEHDGEHLWIARKAKHAKLPAAWEEVFVDNGEMYFHNLRTGETSWDHPLHAELQNLYAKVLADEADEGRMRAARRLQAGALGRLGRRRAMSRPRLGEAHEREEDARFATWLGVSLGDERVGPLLPQGWEKHLAPGIGDHYYHGALSGATQWDHPAWVNFRTALLKAKADEEVQLKLGSTLRFLAGRNQLNIVDLHAMSPASSYSHLYKVIDAINDRFADAMRFPQTAAELEAQSRIMSDNWSAQFRGCVAALDDLGVHVRKPHLAMGFMNRKGSFPVNLQTMAKGNRKFLMMSAEHQGACNDSIAWTTCQFFTHPTAGLKVRGLQLPYFIVADAAYALTDSLHTQTFQYILSVK